VRSLKFKVESKKVKGECLMIGLAIYIFVELAVLREPY